METGPWPKSLIRQTAGARDQTPDPWVQASGLSNAPQQLLKFACGFLY